MIALSAFRGLALVAVVLLASGTVAWAQYFYPSRGQSPEQQNRDRGDCHVWAVQQTGVDPGRMAAPPPPQTGPQGQVLRGAGRGAALGAVGGAIAGDAGKGAAAGAAMGGLFGAMKRADQSKAQQEAYAQQQSAMAGQQAAYQRALAACMTGRGYSVQ
ncbi:MAG TPA: glycine zipper family protein [Methylomirabilota bacterium]|nr:glycine zipper family protein [Methylomirabilota bacterium]